MSPGSIYYLPHLATLPASLQSRLSSISQGVFGHPAVVFSIDPWRSEASILIMTTFGGIPLEHKPRKHQGQWIPVFPNEPHPINGSILYLDTDWGMPKPGYVNTKQLLTVPACILRPLFDQNTGQHFRFRASSFAELQMHCSRTGSSPMRSPGSPRSSSSSGSLHSSPAGSSIRYTPADLLSLRDKSTLTPNIKRRLQTADLDIWRTAIKHPNPASAPLPSIPQPPRHADLDIPPLAPNLAWRPSKPTPVSSPYRQEYVDALVLDLYFPTAPPPAPAPAPLHPLGPGPMISSSFDSAVRGHYRHHYHHPTLTLTITTPLPFDAISPTTSQYWPRGPNAAGNYISCKPPVGGMVGPKMAYAF
ncbi:MAG: hypothetical protein Q9182_001237 [Xanthomendoza sp. 2 TL-2023]